MPDSCYCYADNCGYLVLVAICSIKMEVAVRKVALKHATVVASGRAVLGFRCIFTADELRLAAKSVVSLSYPQNVGSKVQKMINHHVLGLLVQLTWDPVTL